MATQPRYIHPDHMSRDDEQSLGLETQLHEISKALDRISGAMERVNPPPPPAADSWRQISHWTHHRYRHYRWCYKEDDPKAHDYRVMAWKKRTKPEWFCIEVATEHDPKVDERTGKYTEEF